ncbi:MAG: hypothetical protein ACLFTK_11055 [Anaerolineales bacterium]
MTQETSPANNNQLFLIASVVTVVVIVVFVAVAALGNDQPDGSVDDVTPRTTIVAPDDTAP